MSSKKSRQSLADIEEEKLLARVEFVNGLSETEGYNDSPINVDIRNTTPIVLPKLSWFNYELPPKKMKVTNTGHTVILSAKWFEERPFLTHGPMLSNYVFNQMHFHWGPTNTEGSEHTVDNKGHPLEMHVVHFKSSYATQDIALREKDGMIVLIFFFQLQSKNNLALDGMVQSLPYISAPHTSVQICPFALTDMMPTFNEDYLVYWGCVNAVTCKHRVMWLVAREAMGISHAQLDKFRMLMSTTGDPLPKHARKVNMSPRTVFHVNGGETSVSKTLLPVVNFPRSHISQPGPGNRRKQHAEAEKAITKEVPVSKETLPETLYAGDNATGQSVPVYTMGQGIFKLPFGSSSNMGQAVVLTPSNKSVTFDETAPVGDDRRKSDAQVKAKTETEDERLAREWDEAESKRKEGERESQEEELVQRMMEEERRVAEETRRCEEERQAERERESREAEVGLKREHDQQLRRAKGDRDAKTRRKRESLQLPGREEWQKEEGRRKGVQLQEPLEVFHAATQKPSIGFKLRKTLVPPLRMLDMATQAPSLTDVYRVANALSTATVQLGGSSPSGVGLHDDDDNLQSATDDDNPLSATDLPTDDDYPPSATELPTDDDNPLSATELPTDDDNPPSSTGFSDAEGYDNNSQPSPVGQSTTVCPMSTGSRTSSVSFAPVPVTPSDRSSIAVDKGGMSQRDEYSTLSCFDTKDYHMTPKGSLAPTASIRRAEEELEVYNTTFKEVGPLSSERSKK